MSKLIEQVTYYLAEGKLPDWASAAFKEVDAESKSKAAAKPAAPDEFEAGRHTKKELETLGRKAKVQQSLERQQSAAKKVTGRKYGAGYDAGADDEAPTETGKKEWKDNPHLSTLFAPKGAEAQVQKVDAEKKAVVAKKDSKREAALRIINDPKTPKSVADRLRARHKITEESIDEAPSMGAVSRHAEREFATDHATGDVKAGRTAHMKKDGKTVRSFNLELPAHREALRTAMKANKSTGIHTFHVEDALIDFTYENNLVEFVVIQEDDIICEGTGIDEMACVVQASRLFEVYDDEVDTSDVLELVKKVGSSK